MSIIIRPGDKIRPTSWGSGSYIVVIAVGERRIFGRLLLGPGAGARTDAVVEDTWPIDGTFTWEHYREPPRRYAVEIRAPKRGDRYFAPNSIGIGYATPNGLMRVADHDFRPHDVRAVIVDGEWEVTP